MSPAACGGARDMELATTSDCYMFGICYTNSGLCKYFRNCVMPLDTELEALFNHVPTSVCKQCGRKFPAAGKRAYCSESCAEQARREQTAARVRKYREKTRGPHEVD